MVQSTAEALRELVLAHPSGTLIGSLRELAARLDVGIVTLQQSARIVEHEGLLEVRRGPGGGYFGLRPDEAALERSLAAYLRVHGAAYREVSDTMALLDTELMPAAAQCEDESLQGEMTDLLAAIEASDSPEARIAIEEELHRIIFRMVERPLFELLARVTAQVARPQRAPLLFPGPEGVAAWKAARRRVVQAILDRDSGLAMFEAVRYRQAMISSIATNDSNANNCKRIRPNPSRLKMD